MSYRVDVSFEYQKAKSTNLRYSLLVALILTLVLIADVLLVILAKENYSVNFIIAAVITVLFSWFMIFFFTNIFKDINAKYRFYRGYESGLKPAEEVEFIKKEETLSYINGLYVYPLYLRFFDGLVAKEKVIYTLDNSLKYQEGDKLTIPTYQRILMKAEKHQ